MKLGVHVGYWGLGMGPQDQLRVVQEAERLGYDSVWAAEAYGSDAAMSDFDIAPVVNAYVSDDREAARNLMRPVLALYIGGMGSRAQNFYNRLVRRYGFESAAAEIQNLYLDGKREQAGEAIPDELIDMVSLCGPREVVRHRLAAFRDAGVGTLIVTPMAFTTEDRIAQLAAVAELAA
jgi:alkanesulfonate monooxygenase SsuD/methylene tetrahydromethanopterin reductase-like flavin-dependent oxidoreductase (luciferase family)